MIEIKQMSSGYAKKQILRNISVDFKKGRLVSIIGPNGSGKSTLLKSLVGIIVPYSGEILIDGESLSKLNQRNIAQKISYLAQGKGTPDMTVEQMVLHGRFPHLSYPRRYTAKDHDIAFSAMEQMGVSAYADIKMISLSGGMRQNAYVAMALAQDTDYILLDEPTTYLDISHQLQLMKTLRNLADGKKGIVTVMHDLPLAFSLSDEIIVINDGKIVMNDVPKAVCDSGIVKTVFGVTLKFSTDSNEYNYSYKKM